MEKRDNKIHKDYAICRTYDKIRNGELKNFCPHFFCEGDKFQKINILIRYYIEDILKITPEEALNILTYEQIEKDKLKPILKYLVKFKPIEYFNDTTYIKHILYFAYPNLVKPKSETLVIECYKEVLEGKRKNFPKNYFRSYEGEKRAKICFEYLWKDILKIEKKDISKVFLASNETGLRILKQYKLKILIQMLYYSILDMISNMYPDLDLSL